MVGSSRRRRNPTRGVRPGRGWRTRHAFAGSSTSTPTDDDRGRIFHAYSVHVWTVLFKSLTGPLFGQLGRCSFNVEFERLMTALRAEIADGRDIGNDWLLRRRDHRQGQRTGARLPQARSDAAARAAPVVDGERPAGALRRDRPHHRRAAPSRATLTLRRDLGRLGRGAAARAIELRRKPGLRHVVELGGLLERLRQWLRGRATDDRAADEVGAGHVSCRRGAAGGARSRAGSSYSRR